MFLHCEEGDPWISVNRGTKALKQRKGRQDIRKRMLFLFQAILLFDQFIYISQGITISNNEGFNIPDLLTKQFRLTVSVIYLQSFLIVQAWKSCITDILTCDNISRTFVISITHKQSNLYYEHYCERWKFNGSDFSRSAGFRLSEYHRMKHIYIYIYQKI